MAVSTYSVVLEQLSDEEAAIFHWTMVCLLDLGLGPDDAELLAAAKIDHHEVERLLLMGCPVELAARILLP